MTCVIYNNKLQLNNILSRKYTFSVYYAPHLFFVLKQAFNLYMKQKSKTVLKQEKVSNYFALALN